MLPRFDLHQPGTLPKALGLLSQADGSMRPFAGGTNLIPDLRSRREPCRSFLALSGLEELRFIRALDERIEIGGRATVNDLLRSRDIERDAPALHASAKCFAGHMVRNAATVAGNICYGSPSADLLPPLLAIDAEVTLASAAGTRTMPLRSFNVGYKRTELKSGELVTAISWPRPKPSAVQLFYKVGMRKGDAISVVNAAVTMVAQERVCNYVRIALGSVAATVVRAEAAEKMLLGKELNGALIAEAADLATAASAPIDDVRASREYRLHTTRALVKRLLRQAMGG